MFQGEPVSHTTNLVSYPDRVMVRAPVGSSNGSQHPGGPSLRNGNWILVTGCRRIVSGCWMLVTGC